MKLAMLAVWRRLKREGWTSSRWSGDSSTETLVATPEVARPDFSATPLFHPEQYAPRSESHRPAQPRERARMLLQIHDELLFETRREDAEELAQLVVEEMTLGNPLAVPLKVDPEIGANWGEL